MIDNNIREITAQIDELEDLRLEMIQLQNRILHNFSDLENSMDVTYQLSFLVEEIKETLNEIDLTSLGETISDIEDKMGSLSYNYKKAHTAQEKSVYQVQNPFTTPMYLQKPGGI